MSRVWDSGTGYDNIGNRGKSRIGTGSGTPVSTYGTNSLNQDEYVTQTNPSVGQGLLYDADGNVAETYYVGDIDGDEDTDLTDLGILNSMYGYSCEDCENDANCDMGKFARADIDGDCEIGLSDYSMLLTWFGTTGDLSLQNRFTWDAENRLTKVEPVSPASGSKRIEFVYDYRGRRVEKTVTAWDTGGSDWFDYPTERRRFIWNGWLMLRETIETDANSDGDLNDQDEGTRVKTYTWGKDLGGGLESAGGIGGLLAVYDDSATSGSTGDDLAYVYMYDANGNVGQVCDLSQSTASASIVAKYEYDAYGNATVSTGSYATANTYRFSTKPWDDDTGLGYWGCRYYDPRLGRWISRDLVQSSNLYVGMWNDLISWSDPDGRHPRFGQKPLPPGVVKRLPVIRIGPMGRLTNTLNPPGNCTQQQHDDLYADVEKYCHQTDRAARQPPRKKPTRKFCEEAIARATMARNCFNARQKINFTCYNGGNWEHQEEERINKTLSDLGFAIFDQYCNGDRSPKLQPNPAPGFDELHLPQMQQIFFCPTAHPAICIPASILQLLGFGCGAAGAVSAGTA